MNLLVKEVTVLFLLIESFSGVPAYAQDRPSALAKLEGVWTIMSIVENGQAVPKERFNGVVFKFKKENLTWLDASGNVIDDFTVSVDATEQPHTLDLVQSVEKQDNRRRKPKTTFAIYDIKNDTLRICLPRRGEKKRPRSFESATGSHLGVILLKRLKQDTTDNGNSKP